MKPDNIFITRNGTPKLLDFGAARYETSESTHSSASVLTPGYAPVEQYGSMAMQGTFTDVYALSATFYRAVSGVVPIPAPDRMITDPLVPLDKLDGRVPAQIGAALSHGMSVRSEKRTQTAAQLLKEMETPVKRKFLKWLLPAVLAVLILGLGLRKFIPSGPEEVDAAGTEAAVMQTLEQNLNETKSALDRAVMTPTETPEPTLNPTYEALMLFQESLEETQAALQERERLAEAKAETETARPTATSVPTATKTQEPTKTPVPTATRTPKPTSTPKPTATATVKVQSVITDAIRNAQVGDHVKYGHYEQDNNKGNGAEAIEWRVLAREGNRLLLISEYGLDAKAYNEEFVDITWEECTLRSWLNREFYESAFSAEEQKQIALTEVKAEDNERWDTEAGNDTKDRVFLLSISEANTYFNDKTERECKVTDYAEARGAYRYEGDGTGWWWLRSPGVISDDAALVYTDGSVIITGYGVRNSSAVVRPALWLNL